MIKYAIMCLLMVISTLSHAWIITGPYEVKKLAGNINTAGYDEISPVISKDGCKLYFTRVGYPDFEKTLYENGINLHAALTEKEYLAKLGEIYTQAEDENLNDITRSRFNQDIWIAYLTGSEPEIFRPGYPINNALPNSVCAINETDNSLILINQYYSDGDVRQGLSQAALRAENDWTFPKPMHVYDLKNQSREMSMHLSEDAEYMLTSLKRHDSHGEMDIYVSFRVNQDIWSVPVNLGTGINSKFRESTPFLLSDNRTILFSSSRGGTGHDIYYAYRLDDTWSNWTLPEKLDSPVNTKYNESHPYICPKTGELYFNSDRDGSMDIFKVKFFASEKEMKAEKGIYCNVYDGLTGELTDAYLHFSPTVYRDFSRSFHLFDGKLRMMSLQKSKFILRAHKKGYRPKEIIVDPHEYYTNNKAFSEVNFYLFPEEYEQPEEKAEQAGEEREKNEQVTEVRTAGDLPPEKGDAEKEFSINEKVLKVKADKIELGNIYFQRSKDEIRDISYTELDKLVAFMKSNPRARIRIEGHTDSVGDKAALYKLSMDRSNAIKRYLIRKGIHTGRIQTAALGASKPLNDNSTEELRSRNRRVEFYITNLDQLKIK